MTLADVANHLWQSTLCLAVAAGLVRFLRHNDARWRHLLWLAGSLKFLVPFSLLAALGANLPHPGVTAEPSVSVSMSFAALAIGEPFTMSETVIDPASPAEPGRAVIQHDNRPPRSFFGLAVSIWAGGALLLFTARVVRWWRFHVQLRAAAPVLSTREREALARAEARLAVRSPIRLLNTGTMLEPAVVGIVRPALLWPVELSDRLSDRQLEAVFAHEVAHVRRRDNLAAALHRVVELVFWFYPVVWTLERRLLRERERACDEAVLHAGHEPRAYARGILKVSTFCLQSASGSVAGATGANLTQRMEDIMSAHIPSSMNAVRRTLLMSAAVAVIAGPLTVGYLQAAPAGFPEPVALNAPYVGRTGLQSANVQSANVQFAPAAAQPVARVQAASRVSGTVTDQRGGPIAEATVTATPSGGNPVKATTDANGRYVLDLQPAQYELSAGKPGFRQTQSPLFVNRESPVTKDFQLQIGGVTESIMVSAPPVDPSKKPTDYLDMAKASYEQGNLAEAEKLMSMAIDRLRTETAARRAASATSAPATPSTYPSSMVRVGGDIKEPRKIADFKPVYPPVAMAAGVSGIVILETVIGQDGGVMDARVLRGQPLLNQAALDAVTQWRFTPTLLNGAPVEVLMTVTVNFSLQ